MTEEKTDKPRPTADGYANTVTMLGTGGDKSEYGFVMPDRYLATSELSVMYEQDALAARVVRRIVDDATRTKYRLTGTDKNYDWESIESELDDLRVIQQLGDAWRWARLYGGSLCVMGIDDGRPYSEPVDWQRVRRLNSLSVIDSTNVLPIGFVPGLGSRAFSEPQQYEIQIPWSGKSDPLAQQRLIHKSRVIRFDGISVPASRMILNGGWGPGVLQQCWRQLRRLGSAEGYAENLLHELSLLTFKITGLREMQCGGPGNQGQIQQILQSIKWGMSNLNVVALDKEDELQEIKRGVEGVEKLLEKFVDSAVRATDMPRLILLGEQPGGWNSDAKGENRAWYDHVQAEQTTVLTPKINQALEVVFAARKNRGETVPVEWTVEYDPLYTENGPDKAASAQQWANTMQLFIMNGIASPDECRRQLIDLGYLTPIEADSATVTPAEIAQDPLASQTPNGTPNAEIGT